MVDAIPVIYVRYGTMHYAVVRTPSVRRRPVELVLGDSAGVTHASLVCGSFPFVLAGSWAGTARQSTGWRLIQPSSLLLRKCSVVKSDVIDHASEIVCTATRPNEQISHWLSRQYSECCSRRNRLTEWSAAACTCTARERSRASDAAAAIPRRTVVMPDIVDLVHVDEGRGGGRADQHAVAVEEVRCARLNPHDVHVLVGGEEGDQAHR